MLPLLFLSKHRNELTLLVTGITQFKYFNHGVNMGLFEMGLKKNEIKI